MILSTKDMNIVDSNNTFNQLNIISPYDIKNRIEQLNYQLDNVRSNREYDSINNEIEQYKTYLNDKLLSGISYNDYELLSTYDFKPLNGVSTIYEILSFAYNKLSSTGMKSISQILLNMEIDGYIIGNVYVIINFEKLNNNIVKDKESLINSMINENKMKKVVSLKRKDVNEMVESIISRILMENSSEGVLNTKKNQKDKKENKIDEATYKMTDNGDEQSTLLKEISKLCDFGIDMTEEGNVTSASGAFIQIKELVHKIYLNNKDNAIYSY